jgi:hypothetical protein
MKEKHGNEEDDLEGWIAVVVALLVWYMRKLFLS